MGAPSRISATVSRRSAWVPRVSSSRSWLDLGRDGGQRGVDERADRLEHTSRNSCNSAGSEVSSNAISISRRHATPSPTRYASSANASSPLRTNSRATLIGSGPVFGRHRRAGIADVGGGPEVQVGLVAAAHGGREFRVRRRSTGLAPSTASSSSASHSGGALTMICALCRIRSLTRGDGRFHVIDPG